MLETLSKQTGLSREELLARLSRELTDAVDKYTPHGRLPTETDFPRSEGGDYRAFAAEISEKFPPEMGSPLRRRAAAASNESPNHQDNYRSDHCSDQASAFVRAIPAYRLA